MLRLLSPLSVVCLLFAPAAYSDEAQTDLSSAEVHFKVSMFSETYFAFDVVSQEQINDLAVFVGDKSYSVMPAVASKEGFIYRVEKSFPMERSVNLTIVSDLLGLRKNVGIESGRTNEGYQYLAVRPGERVSEPVLKASSPSGQISPSVGQGSHASVTGTHQSHAMAAYGSDPYLAAINRARSRYGLAPIANSPTYQSISQANQRTGRPHGYTGNSFQTWASPGSPDDVVKRWLNSPGHRKIILDGNIRQGGVAAGPSGVTFSGR